MYLRFTLNPLAPAHAMTNNTTADTAAASYPLITIECRYANSNNKSSIMTHGTIEEAAAVGRRFIAREVNRGRSPMPSKAEIVCYDVKARELHREDLDLSTL